jgi:hypothetical protein
MDDTSLLIPYGVERWSADYLDASGCRVPHIVIDPARRAPLRLYDGPYDFIETPPLQDLADPQAQLDYLRAYNERHCSLWGRFQKRFVARYFGFVASEVERNRAALEDRAVAFDGLYRYRDWLFSGLRPLPQAHLCLTDGETQPVRVDFAFWTGDAVLAIDLVGTETPGAARQARRERLAAAGIQAVEIPNAALAADELTDHLPAALLGFWEDDPVPCGPFVPATLAGAEFG